MKHSYTFQIEFRKLAETMGLQDDVAYFLQVVDPYNNKQMTFSEIVHLFSAVGRCFQPAYGASRR